MSTHPSPPAPPVGSQPRMGSRVRMGRHGAPMTVTEVYPIAEVAIVVSDVGTRMTVDFVDVEIIQTPMGGTQ